MKPLGLLLLLCSWSLVLIQAQNATDVTNTDIGNNSTKNDPRTFFGGADHEEYLDWVNITLHGSSSNVSYTSAVFLPSGVDATQGMAIHWSTNEPGYIHLALAVLTY